MNEFMMEGFLDELEKQAFKKQLGEWVNKGTQLVKRISGKAKDVVSKAPKREQSVGQKLMNPKQKAAYNQRQIGEANVAGGKFRGMGAEERAALIRQKRQALGKSMGHSPVLDKRLNLPGTSAPTPGATTPRTFADKAKSFAQRSPRMAKALAYGTGGALVTGGAYSLGASSNPQSPYTQQYAQQYRRY